MCSNQNENVNTLVRVNDILVINYVGTFIICRYTYHKFLDGLC